MQKLLNSPFFFVVFVGICLLISVSLLSNAQRSISRKSGLEKLNTQIESMKQENSELSQKILEAQDPVLREKRIRDELNYVLPGETVVQVNRPLRNTSTQTFFEPLPTPRPALSPFQQWKDIFSDR